MCGGRSARPLYQPCFRVWWAGAWGVEWGGRCVSAGGADPARRATTAPGCRQPSRLALAPLSRRARRPGPARPAPPPGSRRSGELSRPRACGRRRVALRHTPAPRPASAAPPPPADGPHAVRRHPPPGARRSGPPGASGPDTACSAARLDRPPQRRRVSCPLPDGTVPRVAAAVGGARRPEADPLPLFPALHPCPPPPAPSRPPTMSCTPRTRPSPTPRSTTRCLRATLTSKRCGRKSRRAVLPRHGGPAHARLGGG